jgi:hypothetical protein
LAFVGIYFVCAYAIVGYLHESNIILMPDLENQGHCINGYVCD